MLAICDEFKHDAASSGSMLWRLECGAVVAAIFSPRQGSDQEAYRNQDGLVDK